MQSEAAGNREIASRSRARDIFHEMKNEKGSKNENGPQVWESSKISPR